MTDIESLLNRLVPGAGRTAEAPADELPDGLGLEPRGVLGRGGAGVVFRCWDPVLKRDVAVKVAHPGADAAAALLTEAEVTASLEHPAVLPVHRVVRVGGRTCVEFRVAPVTTLEALLVDWRASPATGWTLDHRLRCLHSVASALAHAHARAVFHGDLHPANVAVTADGVAYVLDWGGRPGGVVNPNAAAPERFNGADPSAAGDVWALAALGWELVTLRPLRPRRLGESLSEYVARWAGLAPPALAELADPATLPDPEIVALFGAALQLDPERRPAAAAVVTTLGAIIARRADATRRGQEAEGHLLRSRDAILRFRELARRFSEERRVSAVQRAKVPGYSPIEQKRPLWEAEARVTRLAAERDDAWVRAAEAAVAAIALDAGASALAHESLAELWWIRMEEAEAGRDAGMVGDFRRRVLEHDEGRHRRVLEAPSLLSLSTLIPGATARISRFVASGRRLVPRFHEQHPMPLDRLALAPGSWLVEVEAPGFRTTQYPVLLSRLDHHRNTVALHTDDSIGAGWIFVPGGPFRLGGDPHARQPLDPCTPWIGDRFILRTCVETKDWKEFLDALPVDVAALHVPGEGGLFGGFRAYWTHTETGWEPPAGWELDWPVMAINCRDCEAYAVWRSEKEGRVVRLPTEEEWEKAARGADGRAFPWGDGFDPTFAHMRQSRPGPPSPAPVGSYPIDTSVYGCKDLGGGMREWTSSFLDEGQMVIRGGTWGDDPDDLRSACRSGLHVDFRYSFVSFRLVSEVGAGVGRVG